MSTSNHHRTQLAWLTPPFAQGSEWVPRTAGNHPLASRSRNPTFRPMQHSPGLRSHHLSCCWCNLVEWLLVGQAHTTDHPATRRARSIVDRPWATGIGLGGTQIQCRSLSLRSLSVRARGRCRGARDARARESSRERGAGAAGSLAGWLGPALGACFGQYMN